MQKFTVCVMFDDRDPKPRRRVAVGVFGPGIATIVRVEPMQESARPTAVVPCLEAVNG